MLSYEPFSIQSGTIFRVRLKFELNHHWNLFFYDANFVSLIQIYGNFKVTLKMVPDWFENCAMAHLKAFSQEKNIFAKPSTILAFLGTLANVGSMLQGHFFFKSVGKKVLFNFHE